jgi:putative ABC transport system permease protein
LAAAPGLDAVSISDTIPPSGGTRSRPLASMEIEGQPRRPQGTGGMVAWRYVTPEYFHVLRIPILEGRPFTERDRDPNAFVVILSQSLARRMFSAVDPIGKRIFIQGPQNQGPQGAWTTVIGIARDVTNWGPTPESSPEYYVLRKHSADLNFRNQEPPTGWRSAAVLARTVVDPRLAEGVIRSVIESLDRTLPVEIETLGQGISRIDARPRVYAVLFSVFAAIGVFLAVVGLFGVLSFLVSQRAREIGVRIALGATPARILRLEIRSAAAWTTFGIMLGTAASLAADRLLRSLLFRVEPGDPRVLAGAMVLLYGVALVAAAVPAVRAATLDPSRTLRQE